jgi:hypothetical protein
MHTSYAKPNYRSGFSIGPSQLVKCNRRILSPPPSQYPRPAAAAPFRPTIILSNSEETGRLGYNCRRLGHWYWMPRLLGGFPWKIWWLVADSGSAWSQHQLNSWSHFGLHWTMTWNPVYKRLWSPICRRLGTPTLMSPVISCRPTYIRTAEHLTRRAQINYHLW